MKLLFPLLAMLLLWSCESPHIRQNAHSPEAQENLQAMNKALKIMREKSCEDPLSWYYQGAIHWVPSNIKNNHFCPTFTDSDSLRPSWDNCTHSMNHKEEIHFLVWHRLYIWHFEKIVRKLSGKSDFALPYWDYTNPDHRTLPVLFRDTASSLFEACRFDSLNMGYAIQGPATQALDVTVLNSQKTYQLFNSQMDAAPHGAIHDYVGLGNDTTGQLVFRDPITGNETHWGIMGYVPTAAFDPIFWLHHANIDRLWQKWNNSENGKVILLEELKSQDWSYAFFDEEGKRKEYTPEEIIEILYNLDYEYDDTHMESPKDSRVLQTLTLPQNLVIEQKVNTRQTEICLNNQEIKNPRELRIWVTFEERPMGLFEVHLVNESGTKSVLLGHMNFFGRDHKMEEPVCKRGCCTPQKNSSVTETVFRWGVNSPSLSKNSKLIISQHGGKIVREMTIKKLELF
jgi:hypothetical protein